MEQIELIPQKDNEPLSLKDQHALAAKVTRSISKSKLNALLSIIKESHKRFVEHVASEPGVITREIINTCNSNNPHMISREINRDLLEHNQPFRIIKIPPANGPRSGSWHWYLINTNKFGVTNDGK